MRNTAKQITIWAGIALSLFFTYLALRGISWSQTWYFLKRTQPFELFLALVLMWAGFFWRALRWKRLIDTGQHISYKDCFRVITIGYMANNVLPARIGEIARAYLLSHRNGVTKSFALGTIVTERLGDVVMLVLFISATLLVVPLPALGKEVAIGSAVIALAATVFVMTLVFWHESMPILLGKPMKLVLSEKRADYLLDKVDRFIGGISCGRSVKVLALVGVDSFGIWFSALLMTWAVAHACHIQVGLTEILFTMCVVNLGVMLPSAPGYVGTYQYLCITALGFFGVDNELALAFSIVCHIVWYLPLTLLGLIFFVHDRLTFTELAEGELENT
ncbi:MAG TPA: lysylphosphatidylglycerol synthase transmembrane domain-containing protein [Acidobacteriota bacterium]|nr:lysylphosphatidylglycerol synthase transmembrane domain-containing protein [Acidobacteriota bacterium]HNB74039.1 lysylphosphatidylglycerol synthase transmembrane domain-containing protein [Acidobacteriota bacterium]HNC46109.1 lysylphosphatidylglycerol synthase transmembrane domain-containing protein [Acidobacteriota bacterium]HND21105.1 lysylphosphatidylglycerol synthase transmembrane domain-containing protein [Acidobacteriota bacterium]HNG93807.1 lysylphosphatidylglycerol synthase transmemb